MLTKIAWQVPLGRDHPSPACHHWSLQIPAIGPIARGTDRLGCTARGCRGPHVVQVVPFAHYRNLEGTRHPALHTLAHGAHARARTATVRALQWARAHPPTKQRDCLCHVARRAR